jgi:hypothetical protein
MKYVITENQVDKFISKYIDGFFGGFVDNFFINLPLTYQQFIGTNREQSYL